jgi:hypothetical protein
VRPVAATRLGKKRQHYARSSSLLRGNGLHRKIGHRAEDLKKVQQ